jgi:hypothetical protein
VPGTAATATRTVPATAEAKERTANDRGREQHHDGDPAVAALARSRVLDHARVDVLAVEDGCGQLRLRPGHNELR